MDAPSPFLHACESLGIAFEEGDLLQLERYLDLLLEANQRFNLTAITDPQEAWTRHVFDSLTLMPFITSANAERVIDVGSGGGLPGIPLAIVLPEVAFTLVEATGKKAEFLREAIRRLGLRNVTVVNERAETLGQDLHRSREQFDLATSRAVGKLNTLLELTVPLIREGGHVLAIKGEKAPDEIAEAKPALQALHCVVSDTHRTPTGTIVVIEKQRKTPRQYPRRPGEPKRKPIM